MNDYGDSAQSPNLSQRNRIVGVTLILIGAFVAFKGHTYGLGRLSRLGSGALPFVLGALAVVFGVLIAWINPDGADTAAAIRLRPVIMVLSALLSFALLVEPAGLVVATAALVFLSGAADPEHTWRSLLRLFVFLVIFVDIVFVYLLSIPFSLFGR